jgi:hypothetical protein
MENGIAPFSSIFAPGLAPVAEVWGASVPDSSGNPIGNTCPVVANPGEAWGMNLVARYNSVHLPEIRKSVSDDYFDSAVDFFFCLWGAHPDVDGSCARAVQHNNVAALANAIGENNPSYKVFYHDGTCHAERECDSNFNGGNDLSCTYDGMSTDGVMFRDWVRGWLQLGGYAWDTVK